MNKKRLSVVMAGAMLASSVAPVLAEEVQNNVETSAAQKGELANSLTNKIWAAERFTAKNDPLKGQSVYGIQINDKTPISFVNSNTSTGSISKLQNDVKTALKDLRVGDIVKLVDLGHETVKEDGKDVIASQTTNTKYTEAELEFDVDAKLRALANTETDLIDFSQKSLTDTTLKTSYNKSSKTYTITFKIDINGDSVVNEDDKIELTTNSNRLNFNKYNTTAGDTIDVKDGMDADFKSFPEADAKKVDIDPTVVESFTITSGGDTFTIGDLYDAPFLTAKGQELLEAAKEAATLPTDGSINAKESAVMFLDMVQSKYGTPISNLNTLKADKNGNYKVAVHIANAARIKDDIKDGKWNSNNPNYYDVYYVTGTSRAEIATALGWIDATSAKVDVLAGEDRYATAVKIAKEVNLIGRKGQEPVKTEHIVLVNGGSLVDGLAASPLASYLSEEYTTQAPILLTKANELPRATKRYLKELIDQETNKDVTVHIVGGEAVVSDSVKRELRDLGLRVERLGGENREATSMAVADAITDGVVENAFVVGANGEADAMSIAGYAASQKSPIIVSSYKGLSEDTIDALDGAKVNVIGGEAVVSNSDYEEIEAVAEKVDRVFGSNRKATNAEVINKFYKGDFASKPQSVIVAKDDELIDALTSANLSVEHNAPIVLGTKSLSKDQINAIVTNAKTAKKVYQVGGNVAKEVVKTVAEALNLI